MPVGGAVLTNEALSGFLGPRGLTLAGQAWRGIAHGDSGAITVVRFAEQCNAGGEAVDEVLAADRAELSAAEKPRDRHIPQELSQYTNIMPGLWPHVRTPAIASEQHRALNGLVCVGLQETPQVQIG